LPWQNQHKAGPGGLSAPVSSHLTTYFVFSCPKWSPDPSCSCVGFRGATFLPSSVVPFVCERRLHSQAVVNVRKQQKLATAGRALWLQTATYAAMYIERAKETQTCMTQSLTYDATVRVAACQLG
jgi:hypothetical protein